LEKTSFLTNNEKRQAIGYGNVVAETKYSPHQPRVPAGNGRESGRFGDSDGNTQVAAGRGSPPKAPPISPKPIPPKPSQPKTTDDILKPGGKELGSKNPGATDGIRTVNDVEFDQLKNLLLEGAKEVTAPAGYSGKWYQRSDGATFGLRDSAGSGPTIEITNGGGKTSLPNGYKVHRK
jgi:hypothetical protein